MAAKTSERPSAPSAVTDERPCDGDARQNGCHDFCVTGATQSTAACAGPLAFEGTCSAAGKSSSVAETDRRARELTYPSSRRGSCGVSEASHRATHEEVGHGEP